jgi:hypothetical protein
MKQKSSFRLSMTALLAASLVIAYSNCHARAVGPELLDRNLAVRIAASGLTMPVSLAFLGPNNMLVLEKSAGRVQHVVNGVIQNTALDLAVNFASERG